MKIQTYNDAETYIANSGIADWEFDGNANLEGLTDFIYREWDNDNDNDAEDCDSNQFNNLLCDYLESVNENIGAYSLTREK